jgi:membrane associated rhomboid family serine protease
MVPAAVGFQCPECVQAGQGARTAPRTIFGGRVSGGAAVTFTLIALNVLAYIAERFGGTDFLLRFALVGLVMDPTTGEPVGVATGQWWRLLTAAFLHSPGSILHILFNMSALSVLGPPLEGVLGRARFLTLYLVAAFGGSAASYAFSSPFAVSVGASGAIFGLFAAWIITARRLKADARGMWVLLAINLVISFLGSQIDWRAHLGGLAAGAAVTAAMAFAPRGRARTQVQVTGTVATVLAAAALVVWRTGVLI